MARFALVVKDAFINARGRSACVHARCSLARTLDGTDGRTGTEGEMDGVDAIVHACTYGPIRSAQWRMHAYGISIDANAAAKEDSALAAASRTQNDSRRDYPDLGVEQCHADVCASA